jgi:Asp-tRNA(Asn)/Glu-tRNA(Gln) amidotransferase A subunit family amidase
MNHKPALRLFPDPSETIEGTGAALRAGRTSCVRVLEHCFHQIDLWDGKVNAWVFVNRPGAMAQARALDAELAGGKCRGPLHGIPFGIKDIIDVAGMPTACGFPPWRDRVAAQDATLVGWLRKAGAVILGKTVTTQFAWIDPPPTRNPWNLDRTPGGSSSGSVAAVATGMCLGALGTQTGGTILRPASYWGVAGLTPGHADLPRDGIFPFAPNLDHPGPVARSVRDLMLIFNELYSEVLSSLRPVAEPADRAARLTARAVDAYLAEHDRVSRELSPANPPRLLRLRGYFDRHADDAVRDEFDRAVGLLRDAGAEVVEESDEGWDFEGIVRNHRTLMAAEAAAGHEALYAEKGADYAPKIRSLVEEGLATPVTRYIRVQQGWINHQSAYFERFDGPRQGLAAVVTPATVGPAPDTSTTGDPGFNSPWSYLGGPALSVPTGLSPDGLPLALQLVATTCSIPFQTALWCESVLRRAFEAGSH